MAITQSAARLLRKYGEAVSLTYQSAGETDGATGDVITPSVPVVISGYGYLGAYKSLDVDGVYIRSTDGRLTLEKVSERPQVGWDCTVDGKTYRVMSVRPVRKSAVDIVYILQLRKQ